MKYSRGENPNSRNGFFKGHKLGLGNQYAKGMKHTDEWKEKARLRMLGNTQGFVKGKPSPRKGKKARFPAWNKGKEMPEKCGENHPRWIADRTKVKLDKERGGPLHKQWSKKVKTRDGWRCRIDAKDCQGKVVAHHILSWRKYPNLRYEINNGITLCHFHHPRKRIDELASIPHFKQIIDSNISHLNLEQMTE